MPAAAHEWSLRFDAQRMDLGSQQSLMVVLLSAIEQACAFELRTWAEFAQSWSRDEFLSDIRRLVVPLLMEEVTHLLMDLDEEREIGIDGVVIRLPSSRRGLMARSTLPDIKSEAASLIEERAAAAFDRETAATEEAEVHRADVERIE